jgi:hypothetical protein
MGLSGDVWAVIFLALILKVPLMFLLWALWKGFSLQDTGPPPSDPTISRIALCGYCGSRITVGYDAAILHGQAERIAGRTGEATFDVETRLIRAAVTQPRHFPMEPEHCPDCGERTTWAPIQPIDLSDYARQPGRTG